jgi:hypothetical protein
MACSPIHLSAAGFVTNVLGAQNNNLILVRARRFFRRVTQSAARNS